MTCIFDDPKNKWMWNRYEQHIWESGVKQRKMNKDNNVRLVVGLRIETIHKCCWMNWIAKIGEKGTIGMEPVDMNGTPSLPYWGIRFDNNNSFFLVTPDREDFLWGWCKPLEVLSGTSESAI